jgi:heat shock protein HtpX
MTPTSGFASMDDLIAANKRKSNWLVATMFGLFALLGFSMGKALGLSVGEAVGSMVVGLLVGSAYWLFARYFGDKAVLFASGAREIEKRDHQQLWNVVEEMCIAANMQVPKIYIIDDSAPNAFATGRDPEHAAVAITTGLLEKLDRDELQGVMAHELAHVQNYDIRLMTLMAVMVGAVAMLADMMLRGTMYGGGRRAMRRRSSSNNNNGAQVVWIVIAVICAILAPVAARLIMFSVSREREFLADATAARMTHFPEGLARALAKISGDPEVLEVANRATQHMYIINPLKAHEARAAGAFSTHPPVKDRIDRLNSLMGQV